jgi:hypothetical protein
MEQEKSFGKTIIKGLAGLVLSFALHSGAEAAMAPVEPRTRSEAELAAEPASMPKKEPEKELVTEDENDRNEFGVRVNARHPLVNDGISYTERMLAEIGLPEEDKTFVIADFRKTEKGHVSLGFYRMLENKLEPVNDAQNNPMRINIPYENFMENVKMVEAAYSVLEKNLEKIIEQRVEARIRSEAAKTAPAEKPTAAVATVPVTKPAETKPTYEKSVGPDGIPVVREKVNGQIKRVFVEFPYEVGHIIDQKENRDYGLGISRMAYGTKVTAQIEIRTEKDAVKYILVLSEGNKIPVEDELSLEEVKRMREYVKAKNAFFEKYTGFTTLDEKTNELVLSTSVCETKKRKDVENDPKGKMFSHTAAEYLKMLEKTEGSDKKYGQRIIEELLGNFKPKKEYYIAKKIDDSRTVQMPGPYSYAVLADYLKKKGIDENGLEKALQSLSYEITFCDRGKSEFSVTVRDKTDVVYQTKYTMEDARTRGGNAEEVLKRILRANNYTD